MAGSDVPIICAWGLTFKAGTDDLRDSPALSVIVHLLRRGALVRAHDPTVPPGAQLLEGLDVLEDPYEACRGAATLVVLTGWDVFREVDPVRVAEHMTGRSVFDTRGVLEVERFAAAGLDVRGFG